jgi:MFS transporter, ACDE family, multidrug resistance protein
VPVPDHVPPSRLWPLYVGGFLGPFGGGMVTPMIPELRDGLHTTLAVAATSLTVYMVPFAVFMVVSGTLAERWGRRRTVLAAYLTYAAASLLCALAPHVTLFMLGRAGQGIANAFTTPILMAALTDLTPPQRLGRALGLFGSLQAAGLTFAPLIGGVAAMVDWRWAFVVTLVAALALATQPPEDVRRAPDQPAGGGWRSLRNAPLVLACVIAGLAYLTTVGITLQSALLAGDRFGLAPGGRGAVVAAFGAAGLLAGRSMGRLLDRVGVRRFGLLAYGLLATGSVLAGLSPWLLALVAALALSGVAGLAARVTVNSLAVRSTPDNRGGAASLMLACQFVGGAVAPLVLVPVYRQSATLGLAVGAVFCLVAGVVLLAAPGRWVDAPG